MYLKEIKTNFRIFVITTIFIVSLLTAMNFLIMTNLSMKTNNNSPIFKLDTILNTQADVDSLTDNWSITDHILISPNENIETTITNFSMPALKDIQIDASGYTVNITFQDCNFTRTVYITDDAAVNFYNCLFDGSFRLGNDTSDSPSVIIEDSTFEGAFQTHNFIGSSQLTGLYLKINNSLFNQTVNPESGFIGIISATGNVIISETNITNGIEISNTNNLDITDCIIGSNVQSATVNFQGIKADDIWILNINNCEIKSDTSSSDDQGLMIANSQTVNLQNTDISEKMVLDTIQIGNLLEFSVDESITIDSSGQIDLKDLLTSFSLLDITSSDVDISNISVSDINIHGTQQTINLSTNLFITDDFSIDATSLTTINLDNVTISDKFETSVETTQTVYLNINDCDILQDLILKGSVMTTLTNSLINDTMEVYSTPTASTSIENTAISTLNDYVNPSLTLQSSLITHTYDSMTDKTKRIICAWTGSDNIIGTDYNVSYNIKITKNGMTIYDQNISDSTYSFDATVGDSYLIYITTIDALNNTSTQKIITVSMTPTYGTAMMLAIIILSSVSGALVAVAYYFLYYRAKNKWKKTEIVSIPKGK